MRMSESIGNIAKALAEFQATIKDPKKEGKGNYGKYVKIDDMLPIVRPALAAVGLSVIQNPYSTGTDTITMTTMLMHSSGEWIESDPLTLASARVSAQGSGAAITYARRYCLASFLGIVSDDDDDGQRCETPAKPKVAMATAKQCKDLIQKVSGAGYDPAAVAHKYKVASLNSLTLDQYTDINERVDEFLAGKGA